MWQRTGEADEKLCRLIRKSGRLDDEKPESWPLMVDWGLTVLASELTSVVPRIGTTETEEEVQPGWLGSTEAMYILLSCYTIIFLGKTIQTFVKRMARSWR